jgi:hypothetical protein
MNIQDAKDISVGVAATVVLASCAITLWPVILAVSVVDVLTSSREVSND